MSDRHAAIRDLFLRALDLPKSERDSWLFQQSDNDPELVAEVQSLLFRDAESNGPLDGGIDTQLPSAAGKQIRQRGLNVRCPHCLQQIALVDQDVDVAIYCASCGSNINLVTEERLLNSQVFPAENQQFQILEKVGSGAFGTVFKAFDATLERTVALKLPHATLKDPQDFERFVREARTAAQLSHPGIVSVHEIVLCDQDRPFIVSEFIDGRTLDQWVRDEQPSERDIASMCVKIAESLHHAHDAGVVHRDLKPTNIMVTHEGEPVVMDFGLAKRIAGEITMTMEGHILGTPAYMSPEQATGDTIRTDRRSDLYSLGVILFEMLTGELPFRGSVQMVIQQVIETDAPSPRRFNSRVSKDLETICLKCMQKSTRARYQSAEQLSEDLDRFVRGKPISARPISRFELLARLCHRNPIVTGLAFVTTFTLVLATIVSLIAAGIARTETQIAEEQTASAVHAREREREQRLRADNLALEARRSAQLARTREITRYRQQYVSDINLAFTHSDAGRYDELAVTLSRHLPADDLPDLRSFGWRYLWDSINRHSFELRTPSTSQTPQFLADSKSIAIVQTDAVHVWDCEENSARYVLTHEHVRRVFVDPSGQFIASFDSDKVIYIWDQQTGRKIEAIEPDENTKSMALWTIAYSPDGAAMAVGRGSSVEVWSTSSWMKMHTIANQNSRDIAFSSTGKYLLCTATSTHVAKWRESGKDCGFLKVTLYETLSGERKHVLEQPVVYTNKKARFKLELKFAFSDNDEIVAVQAGLGVGVWRLRDQKMLFLLGEPFADPQDGAQQIVETFALSPGGQEIAVATTDYGPFRSSNRDYSQKSAIRMLAIDEEFQSEKFSAEDLQTQWLLFSGEELIAFSSQKLYVFDPNGRQVNALIVGRLPLYDASLSPDGRKFLSKDMEGDIRYGHVNTPPSHVMERLHQEGISSIALSPMNNAIATASFNHGGLFNGSEEQIRVHSGNGNVKVWGREGSQASIQLWDFESSVLQAKFSPDGQQIATVTGQQDVVLDFLSPNVTRLQTIPTNRRVGRRDYPYRSQRSNLRKTIVAKTYVARAADLTLWDPSTGHRLRDLEDFPGPSTGPVVIDDFIEWSDDGQLLGLVCADGSARVWNTADGTVKAKLGFEGQTVTQCGLTRIGKRFVVGGDSGAVKVFDLERNQTAYEFGLNESVSDVAIANASGRCAVALKNGAVSIVDIEAGEILHSIDAHELPIYHTQFSSDDQKLLTASFDGALVIWDVETGQDLQRIISREHLIFWAQFSRDDKCLITASADDQIRMWDVSTGALRSIWSSPNLKRISRVALSHDSSVLCAGSFDGHFAYWSIYSNGSGMPSIPDNLCYKPKRHENLNLAMPRKSFNQIKLTEEILESLERVGHQYGSLDFSSTDLDDKALARLKHFDRVRELNLSGTDITDEGMRVLQAFTQLQELDLSHTSISDDGLKFLADAKYLNALHLRGCKRITEEGLRWVANRATGGIGVYTRDSGITKEGAARLKREYPDVHFNGAY